MMTMKAGPEKWRPKVLNSLRAMSSLFIESSFEATADGEVCQGQR